MNRKALIALLCFAWTGIAPAASARSVFLNGIDVSSSRNQTLKNVQIKINENGDVFIIAPHYQVNEEETYTPLSRYVQANSTPTHVAPKAEIMPTVGTVPVTANNNAITEPADVISKGDIPTSATTNATGTDVSEKAGTKTGP